MGFSDPFHLVRFTEAQSTYYARALGEIKRGKKTTHWVWYIFPQLIGLSNSAHGKHYGITTLAEAKAYLQHPVLGARLAEISQAVLDSRIKTARALVGPVDDVKLQACMTLFLRADPKEEVFDWQAVLKKYYEAAPHARSDEILDAQVDAAAEDDGTEENA